jgi:hypothetical protein
VALIKFYFYNAGLEHYWIKKFYNLNGVEEYLSNKTYPFEIAYKDIKYKIL